MSLRSPLVLAADFAQEHRPLLREIAQAFLDDRWPTRDELGRAALRRGDDRDVFALLRELPPPLGYVGHDDIVRLSVRGLAVEPGARGLLDEFIRALRLAETYLLSEEPEPKLRSEDLTSTLALAPEPARKLSEVLLSEAWMLGGGSGDASSEWHRDVTEHTRFIVGVTDVADYLRVEGQQRWPTPASAVLSAAQPAAPPAFAGGDSLELAQLHPLILDAVREPWSRSDWSAALQQAWFALRDLVRQRLGDASVDGVRLMERIGDTQPNLALTPMQTPSEQDMHRGVYKFLVGIAHYVRNPQMHESTSPVQQDRVGAFERLAIMSLCARHVESAASPVAVADAVREASQPLFPMTEAAADDLIRTIGTGQRPEFAEALIAASQQAADAEASPVAQRTRFVLHRLLADLAEQDPAITAAAQRCGALIADDVTLLLGIELLTPTVLSALAPRHRDKVALVLIDELSRGFISYGEVTAGDYPRATPRLFAALTEPQRQQLLGTLQKLLAGSREQQAYGMRVAVDVAAQMELADAAALLAAMARAIVRDNAMGAAHELRRGMAGMDVDLRRAMADELYAQADAGGDGAALACRIADADLPTKGLEPNAHGS